ncbi:MAG: phage tail protein [Pseudomonadota bacterium]
MKYFALLTKLGENLLAQATALGTKIELTHMAVGDGGGKLPTPDTNQTKLIAEKRRAAINTLFIDDKNKNQIIAEQIIPEKDGGWWIREIGLFDKDGNLIAVANCPETYKPQLVEGSGRTQSIRMVLIVSHTESVTLKIDPSVVLATRNYVDNEITVIDRKLKSIASFDQFKNLSASDDLNDIMQPGVYVQRRIIDASLKNNYPVATAGTLVVYFSAGDRVIQEFYVFDSILKFRRTIGKVSQDNWAVEYTSENKPSHSDLGLDKIYLRIENPATSAKKLTIPSRIAGHAFQGAGENIKITTQDIFRESIRIGNEDLNSLTAPGLYYQPLNVNATKNRNYPIELAGSMNVYLSADDSVIQEYFVFNSARRYTRKVSIKNLTATVWATQYTSENKPSPKDIGSPTVDEMNNALENKLNKTRPEASESLVIKSIGDYANLSLRKKAGSTGERVDIETMPDANNGSLNIIYRDKDGKNIAITAIPKKSGTMMHIGDYGIGNNGVSGEGLVNNYSTPVGFYYVPEHLGGSPQNIGGNWSFIQAPSAYPTYRCQLGFSDRGSSSGTLFLRLFSAGKESGWARFYHDKNTISDRNGNIKIAGSSSELSDFPVGAPIPWPQSTAPTGYLICNGQTFNKATFPILAKAYPSGVLPDLRGEFIRGLDAGRNVDSGRAVLSSQGDAMRSLSGSVRLQGTESISQETGVFKNAGAFENINSGHGTGNHTSRILGFDSSGVTPTANENRPRNIAFLYIVRAA